MSVCKDLRLRSSGAFFLGRPRVEDRMMRAAPPAAFALPTALPPADMVVGSSVGSLRLLCWRSHARWNRASRNDLARIATKRQGFLAGRDFLVEPSGLRALIENNLPDRNLEDAKIPIHVVATDILTGGTVVLSAGSAPPVSLPKTALPGLLSPARVGD